MHMTVFSMLKHHRILKSDQMLLLDCDQLATNLLRFLGFWKAHNHQIAHTKKVFLED
jgi:hypothetical protein